MAEYVGYLCEISGECIFWSPVSFRDELEVHEKYNQSFLGRYSQKKKKHLPGDSIRDQFENSLEVNSGEIFLIVFTIPKKVASFRVVSEPNPDFKTLDFLPVKSFDLPCDVEKWINFTLGFGQMFYDYFPNLKI